MCINCLFRESPKVVNIHESWEPSLHHFSLSGLLFFKMLFWKVWKHYWKVSLIKSTRAFPRKISHFTSKKICNKCLFHGCCNILYKKYKSLLSSFVRKCIQSCFYFSNTTRNFQRTFSSSNSTMETPKRCLKSVQS